MVHASVMTALDHPSPDIRERATEQIAKSLRAAVKTVKSYEGENSQLFPRHGKSHDVDVVWTGGTFQMFPNNSPTLNRYINAS